MVSKKTTKKNISEIVTDVTKAPPQDDKARKVKAAYKEKAVADSASLTIDKVTQSLTKAGLDISKTLNSVRELFESEIYSLQTIREAIEAKQEELEALYDKEVVAASLTDLVLQYEARRAEVMSAEEESRKNWAKELSDHTNSVRERNELVAKERARENEEYEYNKNISRRNADEAWRVTHTKRIVELQQLEDAKKKEFGDREEVLKKKEIEINAAKEKVDNFDSLVKSEVDKQVAIISNSIRSKQETESRIKSLEFENVKKILEHENSVLKDLIHARDAEISQLRLSLDRKASEVKEVAVAAMNAQSGKQALAAVQETAQSMGGKK